MLVSQSSRRVGHPLTYAKLKKDLVKNVLEHQKIFQASRSADGLHRC